MILDYTFAMRLKSESDMCHVDMEDRKSLEEALKLNKRMKYVIELSVIINDCVDCASCYVVSTT